VDVGRGAIHLTESPRRTLTGVAPTGPMAGKHYPTSTGELMAWFPTDADCLDYLEWLRWPKGFVCPRCSHHGGGRLGEGRVWCDGWADVRR
jgi:hypothetical protein